MPVPTVRPSAWTAFAVAVAFAWPRPAAAQTVGATVERIGTGVYVIVHEDATVEWPNGNTLVVVGDDGVLVVDSDYLPSRAEADIAEIRKLTPLPVRYLVNTHWHYDHNNGNRAYARAFPGLRIVAHQTTRRLMDVNARRYAATVTKAGSGPRAVLDSLRGVLAKAGTGASASDRARLQRDIADREREQQELARFEYEPPNLTFDAGMTVFLGAREVRLMNFGRGNTPGDAVIYLPAEKILATGDLLVAPVPYAFNSIPNEWTGILRRLDGMEASIIVPGHGPVMRDKTYLRRVLALLQTVVEQVRAGAAQGKTVAEVRAGIDLSALRREFAGNDPVLQEVFDESIVTALIDRAFQEARGGV